MDLTTVIQLIVGLKGKSLTDLVGAFRNSIKKPLPPHRWKATEAGQNLGAVVSHHDLGLNAPSAWAEWIWQNGEATHKLHITSIPNSKDVTAALTVTDGNGQTTSATFKSMLKMDSGTEGNFLQLWLIVKVEERGGAGHKYRFAGKIT